jgi:hypothetical protein
MTLHRSELAESSYSSGGSARPDSRITELLATGSVWLLAACFAVLSWKCVNGGVHGPDAHAYWLTGHGNRLYAGGPGTHDAYLYSPAFAALISPMTLLPWTVFLAVWMTAESAAFAWLLKPLGARWGVLAFSACTIEIFIGNIFAFLAISAVVATRYPAGWSFPLLTKITPGLGPVWYLMRREWRSLAESVVGTLGIVAVSFAMAPGAWHAWLLLLTEHRGDQWFLPIRITIALALVTYAAARERRWLLPIAMLIANPVMTHELMSITLLAGIPRLVRSGRHGPAVAT